MEKICWGIIGCGDVTEVKSGPAFNKVPNSKLVAVMRRDKEKAQDYARRHGVPRWYDNAIALINDEEVNAVYIATPPLYHQEYALMSIAAGKPVYIEKPVAMDSVSAEKIAIAANHAGVKVSVAHYRRQQPLFLKVKSLLHEGIIGNVQTVQLQLLQPHKTSMVAQTEDPWRLDASISGGGLFHDLAPHQLDLMYYFFGKPKKLTGLSTNAAALYAVDDTVSGQILFETGVLFNGLWCFVVPTFQNKDACAIIGSKGVMSFSIFQSAPLVITTDHGEQNVHFESLQHVQQPMIENVVQYFLGKKDNPCSAGEGVVVMQMLDAFTKITS